MDLGSQRLGTTCQATKAKGKKVDQGSVGRRHRVTGGAAGERLCGVVAGNECIPGEEQIYGVTEFLRHPGP